MLLPPLNVGTRRCCLMYLFGQLGRREHGESLQLGFLTHIAPCCVTWSDFSPGLHMR